MSSSRRRRKLRPSIRDTGKRQQLPTHLAAMLAADDAERRGDAAAALGHLMESPTDEDGCFVWRPWRVQYLSQIAMLGPVLPRWATSRWVLAQASQWLDDGFRPRAHQALRTAIEVRGGEQLLPGRDRLDARARVVDHDWAFRQIELFELGKLERFIRRGASADLLMGADDMLQWARAPMDAYRLVERRPEALTWARERDGEPIPMPNTGSAAMLWPGDAVLGRLVPTEGMLVFESAPLAVPDEVAERVVADKSAWIEALRDWNGYADAVPLTNPTDHAGLLVELPRIIWQNAVCDQPDTSVLRAVSSRALATAAVDLGRFLLEEFEAPDFRHLDIWACLAAALLEPEVVSELAGRDRDRDVFLRLAVTLADPAASVCRGLANGDLSCAA